MIYHRTIKHIDVMTDRSGDINELLRSRFCLQYEWNPSTLNIEAELSIPVDVAMPTLRENFMGRCE